MRLENTQWELRVTAAQQDAPAARVQPIACPAAQDITFRSADATHVRVAVQYAQLQPAVVAFQATF